MSFRIVGLPAETFAGLFSLSDEELKARRAVRRVADSGGYPCRISLTDAEPGEEVVLVHYEHQPADSPYRSSHAVYVRAGETTYDRVDEVPEQLRKRTLSVRGFDRDGMITDADLVDGRELESLIAKFLGNASVKYLHAHYARRGCYAARIERP